MPRAMKDVYLDYNGSSPLDPRVEQVMARALVDGVGNAASTHSFGRRQRAAVDDARESVATMVGGLPSGVVFTSGATEANNLAIQGALWHEGPKVPIVAVSAVEHASVRRTVDWLDRYGLAKRRTLPVTPGGYVDTDSLAQVIGPGVVLVSVMAANSETGVLNPIAEVAEFAHAAGALFHCDATQFVGRLPFDLHNVGADLVSVSSHKIAGPGGVGALVGTRSGLSRLRPLLHGGGQERGLRSGSLNVAGIVGFGAAARIAAEERVSEGIRIGKLRDRLVEGLKSRIPAVYDVGDTGRRLPNTANIRFKDVDAEALVANMDPVAVSTGSACSSGSVEPSEVLLAMSVPRDAAFESVRFSLGRFTTPQDVDLGIEKAEAAVGHVRAMAGSDT